MQIELANATRTSIYSQTSIREVKLLAKKIIIFF